MAKVLLLTDGTGGDIHPFIEISNTLKLRNQQATLIANQRFENEVRSYGIDFAPLEPEHLIKYWQSERSDKPSTRLSDLMNIDRIIFAVYMHIYNTIKKSICPEKTVLVSHSHLNFVSQTISEKLQLSYMTVFTAPYFVSTLPLSMDSNNNLMNRYRQALGLSPIENWQTWLDAKQMRIGLWPEWFASNEPNRVFKVLPVGFIWNQKHEIGELPETVKALLSTGEPPILITHGTSYPQKSAFFLSAIDACKMLGYKSIVVTRYDEIPSSYLTGDAMRYDYLPFASLLPNIKAIIHHGGIGTLGQALIAGVPQLVLAYGYDRPDNGTRVRHLGIGDCLPPYRWTPGDIAESLERLMTPDVKERCKQLSLQFAREASPAASACDVIDARLSQI